jgi:hypothetical protein
MNEGNIGGGELAEAGVQVQQGLNLLDAHLEGGPVRGLAAPAVAHQLLQSLRTAARLLQPPTGPHILQHLAGEKKQRASTSKCSQEDIGGTDNQMEVTCVEVSQEQKS